MVSLVDENMKNEYQLRAEKFETLRRNKPAPGDILQAKDGKSVIVYVEQKIEHGKLFNRVFYVNCLIDDACSGWYLTSKPCGLKVLILPRAQEKLIGKYGGTDNLLVKKLRVIRHNLANTALIAELVE